MTEGIAYGAARVYAIPIRTRFRGIAVREGMLLEGPAGWGEFCPSADHGDAESAAWLATVACSLRPIDGWLPVPRVPPTPGLALLDTYEQADPERTAWWRPRLVRVRAKLEGEGQARTR